MNLSRLEFPRHVHKDGGSRIVRTVAECLSAMAEGYIVIPPGDFVDDEPSTPEPEKPAIAVSDVAIADLPPKRKPGRPRKQDH